MNSYHISDLERLTGIKAHTIRVWERRYKLIEPNRTDTNIRYYDDEQVKKLLKVSTLVNQGLKISTISGFSDKQINVKIQELEKTGPLDAVCEGFINDLTASMLAFDEVAFEKVFYSAIIRFGIYEALIRVVYPFLRQTGLMWSSNEAMPVQEHFASAIIRRKLIAAIDGLPAPSRKSKRFVLFLPAEEWHEISLLLSDYLIRSKGYKTVYLSQDVPVNNLQAVINNVKPTHLLTFYITRRDPDQLNREMRDLATYNKQCEVLVGGSEAILAGVKKIKNITLLYSPMDLLNLLKR